MDQELDEFDLLWPEYYADHEASSLPAAASMEISSLVPQHPKQWCPARSRPVDVPRAAALVLRRWKEEGEEEDHQEDDGSGGGGGGGNKNISIVVPPHLMLSVVRRAPDGGETPAAWSAATLRSGRPRKRARDLRLLRNSVLRMTGFIEG